MSMVSDTTEAWYAHGKLLLAGEYMVLVGSAALAIPTQLGQWLYVTTKSVKIKGIIHWQQYYADQLIFQATLDLDVLLIMHSSDMQKAKILQKVLHIARRINPHFLANQQAIIEAVSILEFNPQWGLGSSATFLANVAKWARVDPYILLQGTFGGSGYDIACTQVDQPILYQYINEKVHYQLVDFKPSFHKQLFFIYTGHKVNTSYAIHFFSQKIYTHQDINSISAITKAMISVQKLDKFDQYICEQETILSYILQQPTVKSEFFSDYPGAIKSLGAWGGDFMLVTGDEEIVRAYFTKKGYMTIIPYRFMALY